MYVIKRHSASNFAVHKVTTKLYGVNPLNAELNPIRHLLALVGARHIVHVSRIRVKHAYIKNVCLRSGGEE